MTELKTDAALLAALRKATTRTLSADELHRQKVSFILGSVKESSGITREQIEKQLAREAGRTTAG